MIIWYSITFIYLMKNVDDNGSWTPTREFILFINVKKERWKKERSMKKGKAEQKERSIKKGKAEQKERKIEGKKEIFHVILILSHFGRKRKSSNTRRTCRTRR